MGYDFFVGWMCLFFIHDSIFLLIIMVHFSHHLVSLFPPLDVYLPDVPFFFLSLAHLFFLSLVIMISHYPRHFVH